MVTDIEGSTQLQTALGDEIANGLLKAHDALLRETFEEYRGREIRSTGDGFIAVFGSVRNALACAVEIQHRLAERGPAHATHRVKVRIGLHAGEVTLRGNSISGEAVHGAARVAAKAKGAEILVSDVVKGLAGTVVNLSYRDRGRLQLKGFPERWRLHEVLWRDSRSDGVLVANGAVAGTGAMSRQEDRSGPDLGPASQVLAGRETEQRILETHLEEALSRRGVVFTLVGDAGMGKSSLVQWLADRARQRGALVAWGRCWEAVDAPAFWPWAQVVRQLATEVGPAGVEENPEPGRLLSQVSPAITGQQDGSRLAEFDSLTRFLKGVAERKPLVLVLEDLHAADDASLLMLQFLGREIRDSRILVAATYDEAAARGRGDHPRILAEIGREGRHMSLFGLTEAAVAQLYRTIAGEEPPGAIAQAIFRASEGNPLFVEEATRMLTAKGDIHRPDYSVGFRVPTGVRDMIRRRLQRISPEAVEVLSMASVLGREFDVNVLQRLSDLDLDRLLDLVTEGDEADVVEEAGALGRYRFSHILTRETLYEDLTAAKRMRLHRRAAEVLEEIYSASLDRHLPELAHHWFKAAQAGDGKKTMEYATRAAEQAAGQLAFEEAGRLYQRALKAADLAGVDRAVRNDLEERLAEAQAKAGQAVAESSPSAAAQERFQREGDFWTIAYHGTVSRLKDTKGLRFIAHLLRNPGAEIHVLDLVAQVEGPARPAAGTTDPSLGVESEGLGDAGHVLDAAAKAAYKKRLDDLQEEIEEAQAFNDPVRAQRLEDERDALVEQLTAAMGLGGRDRKAASAAERARVSVTKTIKDALKKIAENNSELGQHLNLTVRTGTYCSYMPDPRAQIQWKL